MALERVEESTKEGRGAEVGAVVCGEGELGPALVENELTLVDRYRRHLPLVRTHDGRSTADRYGGPSETQRRDIRARQGRFLQSSDRTRADELQAMDNFFSTVYQAILRLIPYQTLKAVVIASPGFTKDSVGPPHMLA